MFFSIFLDFIWCLKISVSSGMKKQGSLLIHLCIPELSEYLALENHP